MELIHLNKTNIEGYIDGLKRKADKTKQMQRVALNRLDEWADGNIRELTEEDIEDFIVNMKEEGLMNSSINNYLSAIRQYFKRLRKNITPGVNENELRTALLNQKRYNAIIELKDLPKTQTEKEAIPKDALKELLYKAKADNEKHYRMIVLLAYFGMRKSELLALNCEQIDRENRTIRIEGSKTQSGRREIPYAKEIEPFLTCDGDLLLENSRGEQYSHMIFNYMLNKYEDEGTGHLYPHRFRITLDTYFLEDGVDKYIINQLMGWKGQHDMADYYRGKTEKLESEKRKVMEERHYLIPILRAVEGGEEKPDVVGGGV